MADPTKAKTHAGDSDSDAARGTTSRSVRRAVYLLDLLALRGQPVSVAELAQALSIPRSTVYEIVRTLLEASCIEPAADPGKYQLGNQLYRLGMAYRRQVGLLHEAASFAEGLRDEIGETVQLSVLDRGMVLVLLKEDSRRPIAILSQVGSRLPVNWSASGRLLVSDMTDDDLRRRLPDMIVPSPTGEAPVDNELLIRQIRQARERGYDIQVSQASPHTGAIAAPVFGATGRCLATLSIVMPAHRFRDGGIDREISAVIQTANQLSRRMAG